MLGKIFFEHLIKVRGIGKCNSPNKQTEGAEETVSRQSSLSSLLEAVQERRSGNLTLKAQKDSTRIVEKPLGKSNSSGCQMSEQWQLNHQTALAKLNFLALAELQSRY